MAVEIDGKPFQSKSNPEPLWLSTERLPSQGRGNSMAQEYPLRWIKVRRDMVTQDLPDGLLARLLMVRRNLLKRFIRRCKDGKVGGRAVEKLHKVAVIVDQLGEFGCVFAGGNQLIDGAVRLAVAVVWLLMMGWVVRVVRMVSDGKGVDVIEQVGGGIEPSLRVECF